MKEIMTRRKSPNMERKVIHLKVNQEIKQEASKFGETYPKILSSSDAE